MCRGVTWEDNPTSLCTQECDLTCDPLAGCSGPTNSDCNACRYAKDIAANGECLDHCPENTFLTSKDVCKETFEINGIGTNPLHFGLDDNMPETSAFTVSVWAKMEYATPNTNKFSFSYSQSLSFSMNFVLEIQQSGFAMDIFIKDPQHTGLHGRTVKFEVGRMQNAEDSQSAKSVAFSVRHLVRSDWCSYFVLRWRAEKKSRLPLTTTSLPAFLVVGNSVFTSWARRRYLHSVCGIMCFLLKSFHDMRKAVTLR